MPSVAIMGAGPIGLYTAILLKEKYPELDVRVFDKNADRYARPGVIAEMALETINNSFEKIGIPPIVIDDCGGTPKAIYIRDLQHALYTKAQEFGVTIISENYVGLDATDQSLITQHPSGPQKKQLPCDLLIDCTGERRAIMSSFQQATPIATNPVPNHFVAYIDVNAENDYKMQNSLREKAREQGISVMELQKRMLTSFENLSAFRSETGWKEFEPPKVDMRRWSRPREGDENYAAGYCLYFETPAFLDGENEADEETLKDQYTAYVKSLLHLYTGEDIEFRPCNEFGTFQPFSVQPKILTNLVDNTIPGVPIIALGDSFMSAEYTQGTGVTNGVACVNGLMSSLEVDTTIRVNDALWRSHIDGIINKHTKEISQDYTNREKALSSSVLMKAYQSYIAYKSTLIEAESEESIQNAQALATELKKSGDKWNNILLSNEIEKNNCVRFYRAALYLLDEHQGEPEYGNKKTKILSNLGRLYFNIGNFDEAISCLEQAVTLAQNYNVVSMQEPTKLPDYLKCVRLGKELSVLPKGQQGHEKELLENLLDFPHLNKENRKSYTSRLEKVNKELMSIEKTQKAKAASLEEKKKAEPTDDTLSADMSQISNKKT